MIDALNRSLGVGMGERVELVFGAAYFLLGALFLRPVREPSRAEQGPDQAAAPA